MYVCVCAGVTSGQIEQRVKNGASFKDIQRELGVACSCCCCESTIREMTADNKYAYESAPIISRKC